MQRTVLLCKMVACQQELSLYLLLLSKVIEYSIHSLFSWFFVAYYKLISQKCSFSKNTWMTPDLQDFFFFFNPWSYMVMLMSWARTLHARALHPWTLECLILSWWTEEIIDMEELKVDADSNTNILKCERNQKTKWS